MLPGSSPPVRTRPPTPDRPDPCGENSDCLSGWCVEHMGEGVCTQACQEDCPPGWTCRLLGNSGPDPSYACVSDVSNLCKPCAGSADCKSPGGQEDVCVAYGQEGSFCGGGCDGDDDYPWGFSCVETDTIDGIGTVQCVADAGVCPCSAKSVSLALWTPCQTTSDAGQCGGKRVCTGDGLAACDAGVAEAELCNGLDDDCDSDVDEPLLDDGDLVNLCNDGNPCTVDACLGADGCQHEALDAGECVDGDVCSVCADGNPCTAEVCDPALGCQYEPLAGPRDDGDACTDDGCDPDSGCVFVPNSSACDDDDACTIGDACGGGACQPGAPLSCEDGDPCTEDACTPVEGHHHHHGHPRRGALGLCRGPGRPGQRLHRRQRRLRRRRRRTWRRGRRQQLHPARRHGRQPPAGGAVGQRPGRHHLVAAVAELWEALQGRRRGECPASCRG
ncbi:MAG: hypothetical protein ABIK09_13150 [Pseudomonadota bacterium]